MNSSYEIELMLKFLKVNYPIYRSKHNMRFKRSIFVNSNEIYFLSDKKELKNLYFRLLDILRVAFYTDKDIIETTLKSFLQIQQTP